MQSETQPHEYGPSTVGHGEAQCKWCLATNRENAVIAPNHCSARPAPQPSPDSAGLVERLRKLDAAATPGPWETDSEYDGDAIASSGGGCISGYHNYFVGADVDGKWRTLLDTVNSDHKLVEEDYDEDGGRSWDVIGYANAELVAYLRNAVPDILALDATLAAKDAEIARLREAVRVLRNGYADAVSGYEYIKQQHGRLDGVGFDRVTDHFFNWVTMPEREGLLAGSHVLPAFATQETEHG